VESTNTDHFEKFPIVKALVVEQLDSGAEEFESLDNPPSTKEDEEREQQQERVNEKSMRN
jgi:hypothetical protein